MRENRNPCQTLKLANLSLALSVGMNQDQEVLEELVLREGKYSPAVGCTARLRGTSGEIVGHLERVGETHIWSEAEQS